MEAVINRACYFHVRRYPERFDDIKIMNLDSKLVSHIYFIFNICFLNRVKYDQ